MEHRVRELALFNLGIDSKLRGCDLVALKVGNPIQSGFPRRRRRPLRGLRAKAAGT
jgi:hypothetical protein